MSKPLYKLRSRDLIPLYGVVFYQDRNGCRLCNFESKKVTRRHNFLIFYNMVLAGVTIGLVKSLEILLR